MINKAIVNHWNEMMAISNDIINDINVMMVLLIHWSTFDVEGDHYRFPSLILYIWSICSFGDSTLLFDLVPVLLHCSLRA